MITVRTAKTEDAARIAGIATAAVDPTWTEAYVADRLGRDDTLVFVAELTNRTVPTVSPTVTTVATVATVGFAAFRVVGDDGELLQIATDPAHRRLGVGNSLLTEVIKHTKEKTLTSVFLEVRASNTAAIALYEKHGFERIRIRNDYYCEPVEDAVIMRLEL